MKPVAVTLSISFPDRSSAEALARLLVERKLIACGQLMPIHSIFQWEEKVQSEDEVLLQAKTLERHLPAIEALVLEHHSYEVPEIIATRLSWGHQPYLDWIARETGGA